MGMFDRFKELGTGGVKYDEATGAMQTTPWGWRTADGVYVAAGGEGVWLYRALPLAPLSWEDPNTKMAIGGPLETMLQELGSTSRAPVANLRMLSTNRHIHLLSVSWMDVPTPPESASPKLRGYLEEVFNFICPKKFFFIGVKLRNAIELDSTSIKETLKSAVAKGTKDGVPDLSSYQKDKQFIEAILHRNGAKIPTETDLRALEGWYNEGRDTDTLVIAEKDRLVIPNRWDSIEMAALLKFKDPIFHAPHDTWIAEATTHPENAVVVSIRGELEPSEVTRSRARSARRKARSQIEEQEKTGDLEYSEDYAREELSELMEQHFAGSGQASLTNCSIIFGRFARDADETYIDYLRNQFDIDVKPLEYRQIEALDETLPCSSRRLGLNKSFAQDITLGMIAYAGMGNFSELGDKKGLYLGLSDPDLVPVYIDVPAAPIENMPPAMAVIGDPGSGKAQPLDAKVLTPSGWTTMGELKVGDQVVGSDGRPTRVVGVFPQGVRPVYRVTFSDGSTTEADQDHLWAVSTYQDRRNNRPLRVKTTAELLDDITHPSGQRKWAIPLVKPVQHPEADLPVHPYLLGYLLGDGNLNDNASKITVAIDPEDATETVARLTPLLPDGLRLVHDGGTDWRIAKPERGAAPNPLIDALRGLGLMGRHHDDKFVPTVYMHASVEQRLALLQGLMDSDGSVHSKNGIVKFHTTSPMLMEAMRELVRSFGGNGYMSKDEENYYTHKGERKLGKTAYVVPASLPRPYDPFVLSRKANEYARRQRRTPVRTIAEIDFVGHKFTQCIRVAAADSLYVTDDHVVTHNTFATQMLALQAAWDGHTVIFVNPKPDDSLAPFARLAGGRRVALSDLENGGGALDPFRYSPSPEIAAEIADSHILAVLGQGFSQDQELALGSGLKRGAMNGARCVWEALRGVDDASVVKAVTQQMEASTLFALGISTEPVTGMSVGAGLTLIEFDRPLGLPDPSTPPSDYSRDERLSIAAIRLVTRSGLETLLRNKGGMFVVDEAWTFLGSRDGLRMLQRLGREGRSQRILPIFATQRLADIMSSDLEGFISRVLVMKLSDEKEAEAALTLAGVEPSDARKRWLQGAAAVRASEESSGRPAMGIHRDLKGRHSAVQIGPVPQWVIDAISTNPEDRRKLEERRQQGSL